MEDAKTLQAHWKQVSAGKESQETIKQRMY